MPHRTLDSYTKHHGSDAYTVDHYDLDLTVKLGSNLLDGTATLQLRALAPLPAVPLDLHGLRITKVLSEGRRLPVARRFGRHQVQLARTLQPGERLTLVVRYTGNPRPLEGLWGEIGWEELTDGVLVAGQPTGAGTWFPCNDHPSHKSTYAFRITTDAGYTAVCNGRFLEQRRSASRHTWVYEQREPMASYLATVQIGRYQTLTLDPAGRMPAYAPDAALERVRAAFGHQQRMMELFEHSFGPYPFEQYKVVVADDELEIPLEAQGMSIFGLNHLSMEWEAQRLIAHELAHQWFGNSLTLASWKDIWLHEGFACFAEWLYSEHCGDLDVPTRAHDAWQVLDAQDRDIRIADPGAEDMFDDRVYKRGALTLYTLMQAMGRNNFFSMLRAWTELNLHGHVDTDGFLDHAQHYAPHGVLVRQLLQPWLYDKPLPPLGPDALAPVSTLE